MTVRRNVLNSPLLRKGHAHEPSKVAKRKQQTDEINDAVLDWQTMQDEELEGLSSNCQTQSSRYVEKFK